MTQASIESAKMVPNPVSGEPFEVDYLNFTHKELYGIIIQKGGAIWIR